MAPTIAEVLHTSANRTTDETLTTSGGSTGDTLVIIYGSDYYTVADMGTPTSSAGTPTLVETSDAGDLYAHQKVYTVDLATSGAKTVTIPAAINCDIHGVVLRISGGATVDVHAAANWGGVSSSASAVAPSVITTGTDRLLVAAWIQKGGDFPNVYTLPGGMTRRADCDANPFSAMCVASETIASAGATGTRTATWPSGLTQWCAVTIALAAVASEVTGDVTMASTAGLTVTAANAAAAAAALTTTAALSTTATNAAAANVALSATAGLTADAANSAAAAAALAGTAALAVTATKTAPASATLAATAGLSVDAVVGSVAELQAVASLLITAEVTHSNTGGSWYGLLDITREAASIRAAERSRRPVACPNDGEPLQSHRGVLHCPFDGWTDEGG